MRSAFNSFNFCSPSTSTYPSPWKRKGNRRNGVADNIPNGTSFDVMYCITHTTLNWNGFLLLLSEAILLVQKRSKSLVRILMPKQKSKKKMFFREFLLDHPLVLVKRLILSRTALSWRRNVGHGWISIDPVHSTLASLIAVVTTSRGYELLAQRKRIGFDSTAASMEAVPESLQIVKVDLFHFTWK